MQITKISTGSCSNYNLDLGLDWQFWNSQLNQFSVSNLSCKNLSIRKWFVYIFSYVSRHVHNAIKGVGKMGSYQLGTRLLIQTNVVNIVKNIQMLDYLFNLMHCYRMVQVSLFHKLKRLLKKNEWTFNMNEI